jgi:N-acetylmuramoyl-L-alanine amidase
VDLPLPPEPTSNGRYPLARQLGLSAKRVIIDPGHGGHDPGTMSRTGIKEKDLVLDISRRVAEILGQEGEYEVLMTRNDDSYPPLEERTAIANSREADLFVSIHANAVPSRRIRGIETFYLNLATTPDAEETAARENAVSTRRMGELQDILRQIMNNSRIAESSDFAERVHNSMVEGVLDGNFKGSRNRGVKTAPFYVLLGANMPSVLVEVSYLSNTEDAKLLSQDEYRQRIAESIARGIENYTASLKKVARVPTASPTVAGKNRN